MNNLLHLFIILFILKKYLRFWISHWFTFGTSHYHYFSILFILTKKRVYKPRNMGPISTWILWSQLLSIPYSHSAANYILWPLPSPALLHCDETWSWNKWRKMILLEKIILSNKIGLIHELFLQASNGYRHCFSEVQRDRGWGERLT